MTFTLSPLPYYQNWNTGWWNNGKAFHRLLLRSMRNNSQNALIKAAVIKDIDICNHNMFMPVLIFNKLDELGWPSFL